MKLNLNFDLYKGETLLKQWWKVVKAHFEEVQTAHNTLDTALESEATARAGGDSALGGQLGTHISSCGSGTVYGHVKLSDSIVTSSSTATAATPAAVKAAYDKATQGVSDAAAAQSNLAAEISRSEAADSALQQNINAEASARQTEDNALRQSITTEAGARKSADNALSNRAAVLEEKAHTHENEEVLDGITADDVEKWNGIKEQVTQSQLDAAIAYFEEIGFSLSAQFAMLMNALGIVTYDGGWFGEEQDGVSLDGGVFDDVGLSLFDCGGFEPITVNTGGGIAAGAVIDGGNY